MRTCNESTIQRHIQEGGRYDEELDDYDNATGYVTLYGTPARNACGFCGAIHPTNADGWRDDQGRKTRCDNCRRV